MKKKSLISMAVALCLTASVMVGATLAYLTAETGEVKNTFTIGNVKIELEEPSWVPEDGLNLTPGVSVPKDPTVTNTGANDTYVVVTVDGMDEMAEVGFDAEVNDGWVKVDENGVVDAAWEGSLVDGKYAYNAVLTVDAATPALFSEVAYKGLSYTTNYTVVGVAVDENDEAAGVYYVVKDAEGVLVTEEQFATEDAARNYIDSSLLDTTNVSFDLIVKAYAIQTTGFELTADGVYTWVAEMDFAK